MRWNAFDTPVHDSQRVYRQLLSAMAEPGTFAQVSGAPLAPPASGVSLLGRRSLDLLPPGPFRVHLTRLAVCVAISTWCVPDAPWSASAVPSCALPPSFLPHPCGP